MKGIGCCGLAAPVDGEGGARVTAAGPRGADGRVTRWRSRSSSCCRVVRRFTFAGRDSSVTTGEGRCEGGRVMRRSADNGTPWCSNSAGLGSSPARPWLPRSSRGLLAPVERVIGRSTGGCRLLAGQSVVFVDSLRHAASLMVWSARMGIEAT
jgi:hypothetical protein